MGPHEQLIGTTLGSYRLTRVLGVGGMGAVYLGEHPEIESKVAIKLLLPEFVRNEEIVHRFLDEARAVNRVGHPSIVRIHDSAHDEKLGVYLVMEYLDGESLSQLHRRAGPLSPMVTCRLLQQAASALAASHKEGIVHRDLKPANLFLVQDPEVMGGLRVKVLDFGIAKLIEGRNPMRGATETGAFLGSPMFMSPEQCLDSKEVDHRTDIYSLGAIGYHLLSGHYPFEAPSIGRLILMHQQEKPAPVRTHNPEVPEALQLVLSRALETEREHRHQSMEELRDALRALLEPGAMTAPVPPSARPPARMAGTVVDGQLTVTDDADPDAPLATGQSQGPQPGVGPSTTTLSGTVGEQLPRSATSRRLLPLVGAGVALGAGMLAVVVLLATRGPEPQSPPEPVAAHQPAQPDAGPADATRQITLQLVVAPETAAVLLDGARLEQRTLALAQDRREHRLQVTAPGYAPHEGRFVADQDRTLRITLTRAGSIPTGEKPATKKPGPTTKKPEPATKKKPEPATKKKPEPKKPYFDDL